MKDHRLKALVQVAESGSIRAAARALHLSQSALTKALRELEESVGAELLLRSYKGIEFTEAGTTLLSRARLALSILDKARDEIRLLRGGAPHDIAVTVGERHRVGTVPGCDSRCNFTIRSSMSCWRPRPSRSDSAFHSPGCISGPSRPMRRRWRRARRISTASSPRSPCSSP